MKSANPSRVKSPVALTPHLTNHPYSVFTSLSPNHQHLFPLFTSYIFTSSLYHQIDASSALSASTYPYSPPSASLRLAHLSHSSPLPHLHIWCLRRRPSRSLFQAEPSPLRSLRRSSPLNSSYRTSPSSSRRRSLVDSRRPSSLFPPTPPSWRDSHSPDRLPSSVRSSDRHPGRTAEVTRSLHNSAFGGTSHKQHSSI